MLVVVAVAVVVDSIVQILQPLPVVPSVGVIIHLEPHHNAGIDVRW